MTFQGRENAAYAAVHDNDLGGVGGHAFGNIILPLCGSFFIAFWIEFTGHAQFGGRRDDSQQLLFFQSFGSNGMGGFAVVEREHFFYFPPGGLEGCMRSRISHVKEERLPAFGGIVNIGQSRFGDIVRQWNYLEGITDIAHGNQCYQDFNDVRSQFYATSEWQSGYPAATGIGAQHGGIQIDFNAVSGKIGIIPLDNDWQRAAHVYSDEVLISHRPDTEKGTPKFERGKSLSDHQQEVIYISGTAAIRGEESMVTGDVLWQTEITLENIQHLIGLEEGKEKLPEHSGKLELLRVYLKNEKDAQIVKEDMDKLCPGVPVAYLYADVCREELLVEIEGIAHL